MIQEQKKAFAESLDKSNEQVALRMSLVKYARDISIATLTIRQHEKNYIINQDEYPGGAGRRPFGRAF